MAKDKKGKVEGEPAVASRMAKRYAQEVAPKVMERFGVDNVMALPKLEKIVINVNMGRHLEGTKVPANVKDTVLSTLRQISGQKPVVVAAKKSVSNFKVREGYDTAAMVTLRRDRMWHFLDRLVNLTTPRIKDFRGLKRKAFDRQGNYSMGLNEQGVFPEIDMSNVNFTHGMNINFCFRNSDPAKSEFVLEELGMPFVKKDGAN